MKDLEQHRKRAENMVVKTPAYVNPFSDRQIIFKKKNKIRCKTVNVDYLQTVSERTFAHLLAHILDLIQHALILVRHKSLRIILYMPMMKAMN